MMCIVFTEYGCDGSIGEMHLLPEPLFSIPTDNVHFLSVAGAENGRIFLAGKDGCLYEIYYQVQWEFFCKIKGGLFTV